MARFHAGRRPLPVRHLGPQEVAQTDVASGRTAEKEEASEGAVGAHEATVLSDVRHSDQQVIESKLEDTRQIESLWPQDK